jgi:hypothetical protein
VRKILSCLHFPEDSPYTFESFSLYLEWMEEEQNLLKRVESGSLDSVDREKLWKMMAKDFIDLHDDIRVLYIPEMEETYRLSKISLPSIRVRK